MKRAPQAPAPDDVGERRRRELLDATLTLIGERGLEGLRTRDIAARAGANISTLHYYFGTKEELLTAAAAHASQQFARPPETAAKAGKKGATEGEGAWNGGESVGEHLAAAWQGFVAAPHLSVVMQELALRGQRDEATRATFRGIFKAWNEVVEGVLRRGVEAGTLRDDLDPHAGARVLTSFIMGAFLQLGLDRKAFEFLDVAAEIDRWLAPHRTPARRAGKKR